MPCCGSPFRCRAWKRWSTVLQRVPGEPNNWNSVTPADLDDIRRDITCFEGMAAYQQGMANIVGEGGEPERVVQGAGSREFFRR